ncbi:hypothetical protein PsorP6_016349 [Peronosclerospora sorghi]|uniref:Uncharacterized protein n=1 Tax=Peronosclerospora sorghi TaxID=230839 RepID=A0ACC0VLY9_9STRA|nr:hypothetical protein PsorP6_016349 [Peronosclerospora sorghi]
MKQSVWFIVRQLQEVTREGEERCQAPFWLAPAWLAQQGLQCAQNSRCYATRVLNFMQHQWGATAGEAVGEAVVFGREQFQTWRLSKGAQRYQSKYGEVLPLIDHPTTALLVDSQGPPQKLAFPSLLPKSIQISDEEIERRIVISMDELRKEVHEEVATLNSNDRVK